MPAIDARETRIVLVIARQIEAAVNGRDPDRRIDLEPHIDPAIDVIDLVRSHDDRAVSIACGCRGTHDRIDTRSE